MDFRDSPEEAAYRARVRGWLEANATPRRSAEDRFEAGMSDAEHIAAARAWQRRKAAAGYAAITWPTEWGGPGGTPIQQVIYSQEEARYLVPTQVFVNSIGQCLPTVAMWALPQLRELVRFLGSPDMQDALKVHFDGGRIVWDPTYLGCGRLAVMFDAATEPDSLSAAMSVLMELTYARISERLRHLSRPPEPPRERPQVPPKESQ